MTDEPRYLDARLHLLDRQLQDRDDQPICVVDDLEISVPERAGDQQDSTEVVLDERSVQVAGDAEISALLSGRSFLVRVFGGRIPNRHRGAIAWSVVRSIGVTIGLRLKAEELDNTWGERWLRDRVIGRIPGARHSPE